jgi:hypothetical protein
MRLARRLALLVSVALLVMSLSAPGAGADALRQGGFVVPVGFGLGLTSTGTTFTGVLPQNVQCPTSALGGAITINNVVAMPVRATVTAFSFGSCTEPVTLSSCTVTANALAWPSGSIRLTAGPPKVFTVSVPTFASIAISCALPPPTGPVTCTYTGAANLPPQDLPAGWTDATMTAPAIVRFVNSPLRRIAPSAGTCALAPTFSATYRATQAALSLTP